jgi:hypothetical protein
MEQGVSRHDLEGLLRQREPATIQYPESVPHLAEIRSAFLETAIPDSVFERKQPAHGPSAAPKPQRDVLAELATLRRVPSDQSGPIRRSEPDAYVPKTYNEYDLFEPVTPQAFPDDDD